MRCVQILAYMDAMAGERLTVINEVYVSESETNYHNRGIANLLYSSVSSLANCYKGCCRMKWIKSLIFPFYTFFSFFLNRGISMMILSPQ